MTTHLVIKKANLIAGIDDDFGLPGDDLPYFVSLSFEAKEKESLRVMRLTSDEASVLGHALLLHASKSRLREARKAKE